MQGALQDKRKSGLQLGKLCASDELLCRGPLLSASFGVGFVHVM